MNFWIDQERGAHAQVDSVERDDDQIQSEMRSRGAFGGMIAANIRVVDEAGDRGDESCDNFEKHRIRRIADEIRYRWKRETRQIEQEAQEKQSDRKMDEHRMERMPQRFTFEKIL